MADFIWDEFELTGGINWLIGINLVSTREESCEALYIEVMLAQSRFMCRVSNWARCSAYEKVIKCRRPCVKGHSWDDWLINYKFINGQIEGAPRP